MKNPDRVIQQRNGRIRYEKGYNCVIGIRVEKEILLFMIQKEDRIITSYSTHE